MPTWTCAEQFAQRGDLWNARNPQHDADLRVRQVDNPVVGRYYEVDYAVEGYDRPVTRYVQPALPADDALVQNRRETRDEVRARYVKLVKRRHIEPEYRPLRPVLYVGTPSKLTPEQEAQAKRQRAAEKARLTRAANRIQAEENERLALIEALITSRL